MGKYTWDGYFVKKGDTAIIATQSPIQSEVLLQELDRLQATIDLCRERGFITPDGEVRKVLGTLPVTKDGVIVMPGGFVWLKPPHCANPTGYGFRVLEIGDGGYINTKPRTETDARWGDCYSTREAMTAALAATQPAADKAPASE